MAFRQRTMRLLYFHIGMVLFESRRVVALPTEIFRARFLCPHKPIESLTAGTSNVPLVHNLWSIWVLACSVVEDAADVMPCLHFIVGKERG